MEIKTVLFDLDGTLTDSGTGITNSVNYALKKYGMEVENPSKLRHFIGPPLKEQLRVHCGISEEESNQAVAYYREYYTEKGIFENEVYEGIPELLQALKSAGKTVIMATSKPEKYAKIIADHFNISQYFDFIGGSLMDGTRTKKSEVIEYALKECKIQDRESTLMIGDRRYDIQGAKELNIHSMGVLYGYGTREELESAGADIIIKTPGEAAGYLNISINKS
ncbi:HAD family hydrolase [Faecalicatena contorta]|uniref:Phosphoglycolate phosphatase n=1 Tax=Faecalicatena contorta TaxID=39482 RepID=A0A316AP77_9FIRM|nr:HAD family hydrolase [Faecalicatena contorta]PWJ51887.1 phosphoglycolate phosphatase [Faecalicatena contorta]SUQ12165.1 phosphoglycolate phosphatase [Faecalicatena contorta]